MSPLPDPEPYGIRHEEEGLTVAAALCWLAIFDVAFWVGFYFAVRALARLLVGAVN